MNAQMEYIHAPDGSNEVWQGDCLIYRGSPDDEETARRIVQACNAHDELVVALKAMVKEFGYDVVHPSGLVHAEHEAIRSAIAALALLWQVESYINQKKAGVE